MNLGKKKISLRGITTPFGGVSWAPQEKSESDIKNAKAFVIGFLLIYIQLNRNINEKNCLEDEMNRVMAFLKDLDVTDINLGFLREDVALEVFHYSCDEIRKKLWNKGGKLGHYFETSMHLSVNIAPDNEMEFRNLISELDIPKQIVQKDKNSLDILVDVRNYFEQMIFDG